MYVHGAGGAPRQAQVLSAGRGTGMEDRTGQEHISVVRNTFLSTGMHSCHRNGDMNGLLSTEMRGNARSPARKQHLGLSGGAAGAMDARIRTCI